MSDMTTSKKQDRAPSGGGKKLLLQERRRKRQRRQRLMLFSIIGIFVVVVAFFIALPSIISALTPVGNIVTISPVARAQTQDNAAGDPNAPVQIVEYSDFQCPFCAKFTTSGIEEQIIEAYVNTGKVYFVYRTFGQWIGSESVAAGEAAYCAGEQNKFWEYHDYLMYNHTGENVGDFTEKRLIAFAENLSLDMGQFRLCLREDKFLDRIAQDQVDGKALGISATPAFVINGKVITGALPFDQFAQEIEAALAAATP